jgi:hypothetical protein
MAKILLTGMTAPQSSKNANKRNLSFAGVIEKVLTTGGHTVVWDDPSLEIGVEELEMYDAVLVGVGPITSLGANRVYGALNIIDLLWGSKKLSLFIDAPKTIQIGSSLKSVNSTPSNLLKEFYSYRKGYKAVISDIVLSSRISSAASKLMDLDWPTTIYPSLPWNLSSSIGLTRLVTGVGKNLVGINLDSVLISEDSVVETVREPRWVFDVESSSYIKKLSSVLLHPLVPMRWSKGCTDLDTYTQMATSLGSIIAPYKNDGSWWSYKYAQSMNALTPIYTDWQETQELGPAWSMLSYNMEALSSEERIELSYQQRSSYLNSIPTKTQALKLLESILKISN